MRPKAIERPQYGRAACEAYEKVVKWRADKGDAQHWVLFHPTVDVQTTQTLVIRVKSKEEFGGNAEDLQHIKEGHVVHIRTPPYNRDYVVRGWSEPYEDGSMDLYLSHEESYSKDMTDYAITKSILLGHDPRQEVGYHD